MWPCCPPQPPSTDSTEINAQTWTGKCQDGKQQETLSQEPEACWSQEEHQEELKGQMQEVGKEDEGRACEGSPRGEGWMPLKE